MATLELESLTKRFGTSEVVRDVSLEVADGELLVFVGPSGSGKSTLLRMIAGLEAPSGGTLRIDGRDITRESPSKRGMAMVFQSYALYPHMSVFENIAFGLEMAKVERGAREARVREVARTLEIEALLDRKPRQLSGGQRQRVAIGRAIARSPGVFLFDEPLSNLDAELRVRMRLELSELHARLGSTMIYVTHDQVEAMTLADRIVVLRDGRIEQVGTPMALYNDPMTRFVAGFIGSPRMNLLDARVVGSASEGAGEGSIVDVPALALERLRVTTGGRALREGESVVVGVRPEDLRLEPVRADAPGALEIGLVERLGNATHAHLRTEPRVTAELRGQPELRAGQSMRASVEPGACRLFDRQGRRL